ncbi:MAG: heavy metal translocating P-type ATPase, partial [Candidatus Saccharimonadales bacterium]
DILALSAIIASVVLGQDLAGLVVVIMLTGGQGLEDYAEHRSHRELDALLKDSPKLAHVRRGGKIIDLAVAEVKVGDRIVVKPGEIVPVDAVILEGVSSFNEASLTGESLPIDRKIGDQILSGSINGEGLVSAKAIRSAENSQYQQIVHLIGEAEASRAPFVRLADRYSIPFTVAAYIIAITVWVISGHAIRFLEVIIVATPCPLLLAAPIALISGMSRAYKNGVIVKTGSTLEKLAEAKTVVFDKTGTLTSGVLALESTRSYAPYSDNDVLALAAGTEQNSNHVIAAAIVEAAKTKGIKPAKVKRVSEKPGQGLEASFKSDRILVGRADYIASQGIDISKVPSSKARTTVLVAVNDKLAGALFLSDHVREESKRTIEELNRLGIKRTVMITGDNQSTADSIARQVGIKTVYAETLPGEKLHALEDIKERPIIFVGDGVNDAPVLTGADVGIALGARGSTAASESAGIVIMPDDLSKVAAVTQIAKKTFGIAKQSIIIGILLSLLLMFVFATGKFMPIYGAILQEVVDVVVIFNALRAHTIKVSE